MRLIQHLIQTNYQEITLYPREGRLKLLPVHVYTRKTKRSLKEQRQVSPPGRRYRYRLFTNYMDNVGSADPESAASPFFCRLITP